MAAEICPVCGSPAFVCNAPHQDAYGSGPRIHCRASSLHNVPVVETATQKDS